MVFFVKRSTTRLPRYHSFWQGKHKQFAIGAFMAFLMLQLLFLANMSYIYGSVYHQSSRAHNMKILLVDYDGGVIGRAVSGAYQELQGDSFPTFVSHAASDYPTTEDVKAAVCQGHYWGAVYSHTGASNRLSAALSGGQAASSYDASDTLTYIWNAVRYPAFTSSYIQSSLYELAPAATVVYNHLNGTQAAHIVNTSDTAAVQALLNPIQASTDLIQPTTQGARIFYNTVSMVMPILMQFFFLMAINGISESLHFSSKFPRLDNYVVRLILSFAYTLVGSLCMAGYIWAFREDWAVSAGDFGLTWMVLWLLMHVNFFIFDVVTAFIPMQFIPFFVLTWIIMNVTSAIAPFELTPGFYHWSYALPAHEAYTMLITIWSHGCHNREYRALPILFAWWLVGSVASMFAVRFRCEKAALTEKAALNEDAEKAANTAEERTVNGDNQSAKDTQRLPSADTAAEPV